MHALRAQLEGQSFVALWGRLVVIDENRGVFLAEAPPLDAAGLLLPLDPHLEAIASNFTSLTEPHRQLTLFPVLPASAA